MSTKYIKTKRNDDFTPTHITVCLLGDERAREYPVTYYGIAKVDTPEDYTFHAVAMVLTSEEPRREALVVSLPRKGWQSVHDMRCHDFYPPIDQARLEAAQ